MKKQILLSGLLVAAVPMMGRVIDFNKSTVIQLRGFIAAGNAALLGNEYKKDANVNLLNKVLPENMDIRNITTDQMEDLIDGVLGDAIMLDSEIEALDAANAAHLDEFAKRDTGDVDSGFVAVDMGTPADADEFGAAPSGAAAFGTSAAPTQAPQKGPKPALGKKDKKGGKGKPAQAPKSVTPPVQPAPIAQPKPTPAPAPAPIAQPKPTPAPAPAPVAQPKPTPAPAPAPVAQPKPTPTLVEPEEEDEFGAAPSGVAAFGN